MSTSQALVSGKQWGKGGEKRFTLITGFIGGNSIKEDVEIAMEFDNFCNQNNIQVACFN